MKVRRYRTRLLKPALISLAVFLVGAHVTLYLYDERVREDREEQLQVERTAAQNLHFELQRRMDLYEGANRDLAAFFSASQSVTAQEFSEFIRSSRFLKRLEGISSAGYLPKVGVAERQDFETWARTLYPAFQIRQLRSGANFAFPLLYAENDTERDLIDQLRGRDYSSIPDRFEAMWRAVGNDGPTATSVHMSAGDRKRRVVVIFTPVRKAVRTPTPAAEPLAQVEGFTVSVLRVDELFANFYATLRASKQFDVEVYDGESTRANLVFDADHVPDALMGRTDAHRADLRFANQRWSVHFFPVARSVSAKRLDWLMLAVGLMLSSIAAYGVVFVHKLLEARRTDREALARFDTFFENHPFAVCSIDPEWRFIHANQKMAQELGLGQAELVGRRVGEFVAEETREMAAQRFREVLDGAAVAYTNVLVDRQGKRSDMSIVLIPMTTRGKATHVLGFAENITERKALEQELFRRANFDSLTALPNRACFYSQLEQAVKRAARRQIPLVLMYFDIDRFKHINDTYGHDVGDELIRAFASRVRGVVREEDVVARLGGDEFIMIVENLAGEHAADVIAEKLVQSMAEPFKVGDVLIQVSTSIGVAYYRPGMTPDQLVKAGDDAMYAAKRAGRNCYQRTIA